jgi:pyrrolidone-carboxylate peptidase
MITNFEDLTQELSEKERQLIPILMSGFRHITKDKPLKAHEIVDKINKHYPDVKFNQVKLRKCVNHIRTNGLQALIATSEGYYVSNDPTIIKSQIESLLQRARSIEACAVGLKKFL